jgi:hypothetical protein
MTRTRAIRLSDQEEEQIQEFLRQNPIFDFSSLARTAILSFIQKPSLDLKAIKKPKRIPRERGMQ